MKCSTCVHGRVRQFGTSLRASALDCMSGADASGKSGADVPRCVARRRTSRAIGRCRRRRTAAGGRDGKKEGGKGVRSVEPRGRGARGRAGRTISSSVAMPSMPTKMKEMTVTLRAWKL